eukprot:Gb_41155 [translate_table: standard]
MGHQCSLIRSNHVDYTSTLNNTIRAKKYHINFLHDVCHGRVNYKLNRNPSCHEFLRHLYACIVWPALSAQNTKVLPI